MEKTKVIELFGEPIDSGGQEMFVINVLKNMQTELIHIDCLTPFDAYNNTLKSLVENQYNGTVYSLHYPFVIGTGRWFLLKPLYSFLKKNQYDIVHIHTGSSAIMCVYSMAAKLAGVKKIICHSHCTGEYKTARYYINKAISNVILHFTTTDYLSCSKLAGEWKYSKYVATNKLRIIQNGIDIESFRFREEIRQQYRERFQIGNTIVVGHVGRLSYQKNQMYLIEIFNELLKISANYMLMIVGDGADELKIRTKIEEYKLRDSVIFLKNRKDINCLMQAMDVFVLPSRFEGLPIVGIEAQTTGLPCIISDRVSQELAIGNVEYLSIEDSAAVWAKKISEIRYRDRENAWKEIENAGYNVKETAKNIEDLYSINR